MCEDITERKRADEQLARYRGKLESLAVTSVLAEERERRRIANGLHDQVGHSLALAKLKTATLHASVKDTQSQKLIDDIDRCLDETINVTRALVFELSSPVLYELGLVAALETLGDRIEEQTELKLVIESDPVTIPVSEETAIMIYRVVEELVFNVLKHASARNLRVSSRLVGNELQVTVEDDGVGLASSKIDEGPSSNGRFGLFSVRTRIEKLGGQFNIGSSGMGGVRAHLIIPIASTEYGVDATPSNRDMDRSLASLHGQPTSEHQ